VDLFGKKIVVGLFDNDEDVNQAVETLQQRGFGEDDDEIQLVDEHRLAQEKPVPTRNQRIVASPGMGSGGTARGSAVLLDTASDEQQRANETIIENKLIDIGLEGEEATFYAQQLSRGNKLVVVEVDDEDEAAEALGIMKQANAKASIS